jgi:nucleoside phosphorylase
MSHIKPALDPTAYTVGILYIKPLEMHAITAMLDEEHESVAIQQGDTNKYTLGRIGKHNVVILGAPHGAQGTSIMADVAGRIRMEFPNVNVGLMVGVGGGVPIPDQDVRLGDVVVGAPEKGPAVVQFDFGRENPDGFETQHERTLNKPPAQLLQVVTAVQDKLKRRRRGEKSFFDKHLALIEEFEEMADDYRRPTNADRLFLATYLHDGTDCSTHNKQYEEVRAPRNPPGKIKIHYSTILSGNQVMKYEATRDKLSKKFNNALCFEMEAAGVMDTFPCLVVRGICDYSDSHKSKGWQCYAAATAAAYTREILLNMDERIIKGLESVKGSVDEGYTGPMELDAKGMTNNTGANVGSTNTITFSGNNNSGVQSGQNFGTIHFTVGDR